MSNYIRTSLSARNCFVCPLFLAERQQFSTSFFKYKPMSKSDNSFLTFCPLRVNLCGLLWHCLCEMVNVFLNDKSLTHSLTHLRFSSPRILRGLTFEFDKVTFSLSDLKVLLQLHKKMLHIPCDLTYDTYILPLCRVSRNS